MHFFPLCLTILLVSHPLSAQTGREIFEELSRRQRMIESQRVEVDVQVADGEGYTQTNSMVLFTKLGENSLKSLVIFTAPDDVRGTGLLTVQSPTEDTQLLYLPGMDRIQRIESSERTQRLGGSDFTFEDISPRDPDDYEIELFRTFDTSWVLRVTPKPSANSAYRLLVFIVDRDTYAVTRMDAYERPGKRLKHIVASNFSEVRSAVWQPDRVVMEHDESGRRTILDFRERQISTPLSDNLFTEEQLRQGADGL